MKSTLAILVIEDDKYCRLNLREILRPFGIIDEADNEKTAVQKLNTGHYDIVITDIELDQGSGLEIIPQIIKKGGHCIVVSSFEDEEVVEKAYTLGAKHYLSKHKLRDQLPIYITKYLNAKSERFQKFIMEEFITQDKILIEELFRLCEINLKGQNLLITGPTGTGKSLLGKLIHSFTHPEAPLIHLNCSEIPENLLESELFGHEKGAFTGADQRKEGKLKMAHNGTLFLDEVATMSLSMQQKLLKAIDEKTFYPIGSTVPVKSDFTLISATCENIPQKMSKKEFREDLFYRLNGHQFILTPLCERPMDIELLVKGFQRASSRRWVIKSDALELLKQHSWPGNVRELKKVCENFSQNISGIIDAVVVKKLLAKSLVSLTPNDDQWGEFILQNGLKSLISSIERKAVEESMKRNNGKITACIKELKISSSAFYRILQDHQLQF